MSGPTRPTGGITWPGGSFRRYLTYCVLVSVAIIVLAALADAYGPPISEGTFFAGFLLFIFGGSYALAVLIVWRVNRRSPNGILKRLHRRRRHEVRVPMARFTWNPSLPRGQGNRVYGPGRATYWLDEDNLVHLRFDPAEGPPEEWVSPKREAVPDPQPLAMRMLLVAYPLAIVAGFFLGYFVVARHSADRLRGGLWYALVGGLIAWLFLRFVSIVMRARGHVPGRVKAQ